VAERGLDLQPASPAFLLFPQGQDPLTPLQGPLWAQPHTSTTANQVSAQLHIIRSSGLSGVIQGHGEGAQGQNGITQGHIMKSPKVSDVNQSQ
jgi:hypothetical protein